MDVSRQLHDGCVTPQRGAGIARWMCHAMDVSRGGIPILHLLDPVRRAFESKIIPFLLKFFSFGTYFFKLYQYFFIFIGFFKKQTEN